MRRTVFYLAMLAPAVWMAAKSHGDDSTGSAGRRVPLVFSGGHDTDPRDRGRPVSLVAGALGVSEDVFREAFRHVRPAPAGTRPDPEQVRKNKAALMQALGKYGVTNERLDEVSNRYRYVRSRGEMWPTSPAEGYAEVVNGKITSLVITKGGSGYSSAPQVSVAGMSGVKAETSIAFSKDLNENGAVTSASLVE